MTLHAAVDADKNPLLEAPDLLRELPREVVPVGQLKASLAPRERREDPAHVRLLAETEGSSDPILVHRPTMRVIDGAHRLRAALMRGRTEVEVQFFDGSEADAFVLSVQLNVRHGLPLTLDERKAAARRIISSHPHWSDRGIAQRTGLSPKTVGKVRRTGGEATDLGNRVGSDGRIRPISTVEGRRSAAALLAAHPEISLRELSRRAGLSVGTVRDVRERLNRGEDPVPERLRGEQERPAVVAPPLVTAPPRGRAGAPQAEANHPQNEAVRAEARIAGFDPVTAVRKLARDPSLRATESGRWLLRMLLATEMAQPQWEEIAEAIPAHCVPLIRAVVLTRCEDWKNLANMVPQESEKST
ncbi:ParB/RepB/Spo0J family partition protein [Streptomyces sp.]|uniref:ParB/RepB/Spo0J family partition protein n=1 Tax=Streptomyces sp. TaxID=1931 RepID=UPI002D795387|nr:ParB N-terminal domain-containing protein [Streptomyces sp.]HET6356185.1 ParB N-terminal domain-containing protein [Streptomyces sp.]